MRIEFKYGADRQRRAMYTYVDDVLVKTTYYAGLYEQTITDGGSTTTHYNYINTVDGLSAVVIDDGLNEDLYYINKDNLGSITALFDESGSYVAEYSYDSWGRQRKPTDWLAYTTPDFDYITRGYTGHEHLPFPNLINMNGRVYDPITARFLSPDPFVQNAAFSQDFNRYSYVNNNPLRFTDPSGYMHQGWDSHYQMRRNIAIQCANSHGEWNDQFGWNIKKWLEGKGGMGGGNDIFSVYAGGVELSLSDFGLSDVTLDAPGVAILNNLLSNTGIQITDYSNQGIQLTLSWYEGKGGITASGDGWMAQTAQTFAFKTLFVAMHNISDPSRWGNFTGTKNNQYYFEGVKVYETNIVSAFGGDGVTIPNVGIFVGTGLKNNIDLLRHEYGHILQHKKWGGKIWTEMAITSLTSASKDPSNHMNVWSEWTANFMSYNYFGSPQDWDKDYYYTWPKEVGKDTWPQFPSGSYDLMINWLGN